MSKIELTPAWLLHSRPYRDSSLLLDAFSHDHGRLALVARGARKPGSRFSGLTSAFQPLLLSASGRSDLKTLTGLEPAGALVALKGVSLFSGLYLNELLLRLTARQDPHPALFHAYQTTIASLSLGDEIQPALREFELRLLIELGFAPTFDRLSGNQDSLVLASKAYSVIPGVGVVDAEPSAADIVSGDVLLAMAGGQFEDPSHWRAMRSVLSSILAFYLGPKPLKSRELMRELAPEKKS